MPKSASSLLLNTEVTRALHSAIAAVIAAALQEQQQQQKQKQKTPLPLSEVERRVAKAAAGPIKRPRKRGFRGTPPPATFDLHALPDRALLTEYETAAAARLSTNTLATWRTRPDHPLKWTVIGGGRIRYYVAAVKQYLATGRRPQPGRPKKMDAAPTPKRTPAKTPAQRRAKTAEIGLQDAAPPRRRGRPRKPPAQPQHRPRAADDLAAAQEP